MRVGQPFPFWRGATQLNLRVSAAVPADLVRLAAGSEVAVAPRPRIRPAAASASGGVAVETGALSSQEGQQLDVEGIAIWLRIQVHTAQLHSARQDRSGHASSSITRQTLWLLGVCEQVVSGLHALL